ncbi:MAG TPA: hypothetical protein VN758_00570 [Solirubrobacterales bacterium]|nr:hypothetical protein [Solirubrobacterales bacterium]
MSSAPGVISTIGEDILTQAVTSDETPFVVGLSERGSVLEPTLITSKRAVVPLLGARQSWSPIFDTFDIAFREGPDGAAVPHFFIRAVGPAHKYASKKLVDGVTNVLEATAVSPGEWGDDIDVAIVAGVTEGTFHVTVTDGDTLEKSPELNNNDEAVAWAAAQSSLITLKVLGATDPDVQSVSLSGGDDDRENVDAEVIAKAVALFTEDLGFGPVAAPGYTSEAVHKVIMAHCKATNRNPVLDAVDSADEADLIGDAGALKSLEGNRQASVFGPWDIAPGLTGGTTRVVSPSARQIGAMARVARETGNPNIPAAGDQGKAKYVIGLTQTYDEDQRKALNDAGVNVSIMEDGKPTTYGWRTLANPVTEKAWLALSNARLALSMAAKAKKILKRYMFAQLDGEGETRGRAEGAIINEVHTPARTARAVYESGVTVTQETNPDDGMIGRLEATQFLKPTKFAEVIELTTVVTNES